jgi:hypothetical protein
MKSTFYVLIGYRMDRAGCWGLTKITVYFSAKSCRWIYLSKLQATHLLMIMGLWTSTSKISQENAELLQVILQIAVFLCK